ncbi:ribosome recycling factor [Buchnera aphidicola (Taiwanaphis decaspermi)]|uniref:ribosome recycling factor n=1 Tax=Buchnera aphidicola TaxID=9 RepID=UPI0031B7F894
MINNILKKTEEKMKKKIFFFKTNINKLRTNYASPELLSNIFIDYYGKKTTLKEVSNIVAENSFTLKINVFDVNIIKQIEKSILNSELNLNPISKGNTIKLIIPALTEERRKNLIKLVKKESESTKILIRNIRRNSKKYINSCAKSKLINTDENKFYENKIQKLTNVYVKEIDKILKLKVAQLSKI